MQVCSPLLLCVSLRLPETVALGATLWISPETPNSAARVRVSKAEVEVDMTRVELLTVREVRETGAQVKFCAAAAAVKFGALTNSANSRA